MNSYVLVKWVSTLQKGCNGEGTSSASVPLLRFLAREGGSFTMCAAINHQGILYHHSTLGPYNTALITFLDILTPAEQMDGPEQLLWSATGSSTTHVFPFFICHHILHFSTLLRSFFQPAVGRYMNALWAHIRAGFVMPGGTLPAAWPGRTLPVMSMRSFGQTETKGRMQPNFLFL